MRGRDEQALFERGVVHEGRHVEVDRQERLAVPGVHELHAEEEATAPDLANDVEVPERRLELIAESGSTFAHAVDQAAFHQEVEHGEADGRGQRCAVPRVPEVELAGPLIDRVVDVLAAQGRSERRVPGAEAFPDRHDVRLDGELIGREPAPRPADAGHDLVETDQEPVLCPAFVEALPEAIGRRVRGERRRTHRFDEERGDGLRSGLLEEPIELRQRRLSGRVGPPGRGRDVQVLGKVRRERLLQRSATGERQCAHRRSVVRLPRRDHAPARGVAALYVVQASELQRGFVRLRTAGDQADPCHPRRDDLQESVGETLLRLAREVVVVEVREPFGLLRGCLRDLRHAGPETRDHRAAGAGVEDPATVGRGEPHAVSSLDVRVVEVEEAREDVGGGRVDRRGGHATTAQPARSSRSASWGASIPATSWRKCSNNWNARARLSPAMRFVSASNASGSTPSPSSSWR
jgi:hypothetical protein